MPDDPVRHDGRRMEYSNLMVSSWFPELTLFAQFLFLLSIIFGQCGMSLRAEVACRFLFDNVGQ